jgi:hypothetical protein
MTVDARRGATGMTLVDGLSSVIRLPSKRKRHSRNR